MELKDLTVTGFCEITASDAPAPGGGSVSALAGTLAAALGEMVARLTVGKEKYAQVQPEMERLLEELPPVRQRLLEAIDRDSRAFDRYMAALTLPKGTHEEKEVRKNAMQEGLKEAAQVPLEVARAAVSLFPALELVVTRGNSNAVTDGMVGTMLARSAVLGALFNVRVNLGSIHDAAFVEKLDRETRTLQEQALRWERQILGQTELAGLE